MQNKIPALAWTIGLSGIFLLTLAAMALLGLPMEWLGPRALWFVSAAGVALVSAGYFIHEEARAYAGVVASMFLGGAAQLWLTQPLWFPALRLTPRDGADAFMFALIALQAAIAGICLLRSGKMTRLGALAREFGLLRILIFLGLSVFFSVSIMGYLPRGYLASYGLHLIAGGAMIAVNLMSVAALLALPPPFTTHRGFHPVIPAAVAFLASALLAWFGFDRLPHVEDELAYLFQAKTLAQGSFTAPAPPAELWPGFEYYLLDISNGRWFATTSPGWPAVLSLGVLVGAPWLINPLLAGVAVLFAHGLTRRLAGRDQADIVALLMCTSPWFLGASASLMTHTLTITLTLASWWLLLIPARRQPRDAALWLLAGLAMGWVFTTRQLEGVLLGTLTGLWLVARWREPRALWRVVCYSSGAILAGSYYFLHNLALTGNLLTSPLSRYLNTLWHGEANAYGFGPGIGPAGGWGALDISPGHTPYEGLINTLHNLSGLQLELFGWGIGSLALVYGLFLWGRARRTDWAMSALALTVIAAMFLYWFSGGFYLGPRYWFALFFPILFLSASGYFAITRRLERLGVHAYSAGVTLFILAVFGISIFTPWRAVTKYHRYGDVTNTIQRAAARGEFGNALVFFDISADPVSAFVLNDPWFPADRAIFVRDLGTEANARVAAAFPGRKIIYFTDKPTP